MIELSAMNRSVPQQLYVDDVFSTYLRTGTGSSQTIATGIDLQTRGGVVRTKSRSAATDHSVHATALGTTYDLISNSNAAMTNESQSLTAVSTTGHAWGTLAKVNTNGATYVDWVAADASRFHKTTTVVKSAGSNATVDLSSLGAVGMIEVRRAELSQTGSWYVWHRSLTAGKLLIGESTAGEATLGHITVSGTTLTLVDGVIADGTYLIEAWAHDTASVGIVQCGSFATDGSGNATVSLGWEPQLYTLKAISTTSNWYLQDSMRGLTSQSSGNVSAGLYQNTSGTEWNSNDWGITPTGMKFGSAGVSTTYIYLAIRRPNKPPTTGAQVYNAIARTGTGAAATVTGAGFAPDLVMPLNRSLSGYGKYSFDRLRGVNIGVDSTATSAESSLSQAVNEFGMDGVTIGTNTAFNTNTATYIDAFLRRAPGTFDEICYDGSGANKTEAVPVLGVPAELWVVKSRSGATQWVWGSTLLANTEKIVMPTVNGRVTDATVWNSTYPTATTLSLGTSTDVNNSGATYSALLWATLAGISKVGTYDGNGTSQPNDCGFSAGARFVMIIRATASTAQDIFIWDSARGIVAGNDPHLSLNTTAAEVTTDDSIDPYSAGFIVNQNAATNINVSGATYIYLAFA